MNSVGVVIKLIDIIFDVQLLFDSLFLFLQIDFTKRYSNVDMDYNFTEKEQKSFRNAFTLFDKDHDGKLSTKEVDDVLRFLGKDPTEYEMEFVLKDLDMYGNGTLTFPQFLKLLSQKYNDTKFNVEEMKAVFRIFDKDGDGYITSDEIQEEMSKHGDVFSDQQIKQMMEGADSNGDGRIDYEEFVKLMESIK